MTTSQKKKQRENKQTNQPRVRWEELVEKISAGVDVDMEGEDENGVESEEDESVDGDGFAVGLHAAELHGAAVARQLEEQARLQQHEQHHPHQHRSPVRHY